MSAKPTDEVYMHGELTEADMIAFPKIGEGGPQLLTTAVDEDELICTMNLQK